MAATILITDDNSDYRQSVIEVLRLEGYAVTEAADGAQALEQIAALRPDLILCDVDMPVMDGFAVLRQVKSDVTLAAIPFLLVTGRDDTESVAHGKALGADDYMIKPMNVDLLLRKIQEHLSPKPRPIPG